MVDFHVDPIRLEVVRNYLEHAKLLKLDDDSSQFQINTQDDLIRYREAKN